MSRWCPQGCERRRIRSSHLAGPKWGSANEEKDGMETKLKTLLDEMQRLGNTLAANSRTTGDYKRGYKAGVRFAMNRLGDFIAKEANREELNALPIADLRHYVRTGETTPALKEALGDVLAHPPMFGGAESENQADGFGEN